MRTTAPALALLLFSCAAEPSGVPEDLYHTWVAESISFIGLEGPEGSSPGMRLTFSPDKILWAFETPDGPQTFEGLYYLDATKSPKQIDIGKPADTEQMTFGLGIYEIEGDTLTICMDAVRPKSFSDDDVLSRLVLKRVD